ncbi:glyoxalase/bleomycin resistance/dioxygenase family protein, partial [Peptostreptococcus anaerobius]|uniref:glyoxalase/bleomycin resistance/dioxygenase family protein n=1 Tax=Peptostreptococcus anaerobius TaxID=1261 RepID=UPI001FADDA97|nr:glyoxalase/bleomycin resistance/dioxygenase family protein [Peptostreptococcus anaerobius]
AFRRWPVTLGLIARVQTTRWTGGHDYPQIQFLNELSVSDNGKSYIRFYDLDDNLIEVASWKQCIKRG